MIIYLNLAGGKSFVFIVIFFRHQNYKIKLIAIILIKVVFLVKYFYQLSPMLSGFSASVHTQVCRVLEKN